MQTAESSRVCEIKIVYGSSRVIKKVEIRHIWIVVGVGWSIIEEAGGWMTGTYAYTVVAALATRPPSGSGRAVGTTDA